MNAIMQWFDDPRFLRLGLSLVHFLWQGALLGVAAAIVMSWMRGASSRRRYAIMLTAMLGMAIAPLVTFLILPSPRKPAERASAATPAELPAQEIMSTALASKSISEAPLAAPDRPLDPGVETGAATAPAIGFPARLNFGWAWIVGHTSWFVAAWAVGVCLFSVRLMIGLGGASRVRRIGVKPVPIDCQAWSAELATTFGIRRPIKLAQSALVKVPVVVGWLRPIVLLPASVITGLPEPELRAILAHELAHIRRHDYLVNTLQTIVETLLFYHPAVWWLSNAIRQEREQCCDDLAADVCGDRVVVAKALVLLAEVRALAGFPALAATGGRLSRRIRRLLTRPTDLQRPARWQSVAGASAAILLMAGTLISVNMLAGGFTESQASAQEVTRKTNGTEDDRHRDLEKRLSKPITLDDRETSLEKALGQLSKASGINVILDQPALKRLKISAQQPINVTVDEIAAKDALLLILQSVEPRLTYKITDDSLLVTGEEKPAAGDPAETETLKSKADDMKNGLGRLEKENDSVQRELFRVQQQLRSEQGKSEADLKQEAEALLPLRQQFAEKERELQQKHQLIDKYRMKIQELQIKHQEELKRAAETDPRSEEAQLREQEAAEIGKLEGTWEGTDKINGKEMVGFQTWVFHGHDFASYSGHAKKEKPVGEEDGQWLMFYVNPLKTEKEMTIYGKNMLIQAIYRLDGDTLTVCYFGWSQVDRPTSFEPTKEDVLPSVVWTFHRVNPEQK